MSRTPVDRRATTAPASATATANAEARSTPGPLRESAPDPRISRSRQRTLGAALDLIAERGIAGASIEAISARSGVAKTTIYRQWPNHAALVLDAFRSVTPDPPQPDTGSLRGDLKVLVGGLAEAIGQGRGAALMASLIDAAQRDPQFAQMHAQESRRRRQAVLAVLARGIERGEFPSDTDCEALVDRLAGPVFHRRFITGLPLDRDFGERVVDAVLGGL